MVSTSGGGPKLMVGKGWQESGGMAACSAHSRALASRSNLSSANRKFSPPCSSSNAWIYSACRNADKARARTAESAAMGQRGAKHARQAAEHGREVLKHAQQQAEQGMGQQQAVVRAQQVVRSGMPGAKQAPGAVPPAFRRRGVESPEPQVTLQDVQGALLGWRRCVSALMRRHSKGRPVRGQLGEAASHDPFPPGGHHWSRNGALAPQSRPVPAPHPAAARCVAQDMSQFAVLRRRRPGGSSPVEAPKRIRVRDMQQLLLDVAARPAEWPASRVQQRVGCSAADAAALLRHVATPIVERPADESEPVARWPSYALLRQQQER